MTILRNATLALALTGAATPALAADEMKPAPTMARTFTFAAQNGSAESGTVTLTPVEGDATTVTIDLKGGLAAGQPAHIHPGSCAKLDPTPAYPLKAVVDGTSTTVVKAPLKKLLAGGFAVNVHKSASEAATYVACADLTNASPAPAPGPAASPK